MTAKRPRYSKEESARRGEEIFERDTGPKLKGANPRDFAPPASYPWHTRAAAPTLTL